MFQLGADLATPQDAAAAWVVRMDAAPVAWLEGLIDQMTAELPELKNFILPGGAPSAAQLHIARTICRRAERIATQLSESEDIGAQVIPYINRLSDYLFTLARWENLQAGVPESKWTAR
jgi:cob(I)alamin adenosyltransferase